LRTTNNLSDVTNAATARSNIGAAAAADVSNVDNTSDASKPVSTAQQTALDLKADATALTTETNARVDADNRREFAGGAYCDGQTGYVQFNEAEIFTDTESRTWGGTCLIPQNSSDGIYIFFSRQFATSGQGVDFRLRNTAAHLIIEGSTQTVAIDNLNVSDFPINKMFKWCATYDALNSTLNLFIDGQRVGDETTVSSFGTVTESRTATIGANLGNNKYSAIVAKDYYKFNTALTATQAAELYQQGLQPWLAANPEYRRGGDLIPFDDFSSSANWTTSSNWTISSGVASYDALAPNNLIYNISNLNYKIGDIIKVNFNSTASGKIQFREGTGNTTINPSNDSTFTSSFADVISGSNEIIFESTLASSGFAIRSNTTNAFSIDNLQVTLIGSLATLPLNDDCRQLKDISGNRNDATASESGVTHLKQKDLHSFRDDNADGTGGSYLIANADILAENEVITGVTVDGRFYAASGAQDLTKRRIKLEDHGSHVDVKRSNGTADDAAIAVTNPSDGTDFAITVLTQRI